MRELGVVRAEVKLLAGKCIECNTVFLLRDHDKCPNCKCSAVVLTYTPDSRQTFSQDERKAQPL